MKTLQTVKQILDLFICEDSLREWMMQPFTYKDKIGATTAFEMVLLPNMGMDFPSADDMVAKVMNFRPHKDMIYDVTDFKKALKKMPFKMVPPTKECTECNGTGEIEWEYKSHTRNDKCPICDGEGYLRAEGELIKVWIDCKTIMIDDGSITATRLEKVVQVAELLNVTNVKLINHPHQSAAYVFEVGEAVVLSMPYIERDDIAFIYPIKKQ